MAALKIVSGGQECAVLANVAVHPAAEMFPLMQGAEFAELVADIVRYGQRDPIVMTPDGQLLDGRNRWRACATAGVTPVTRVESGEPWSYVISTNLHRRHLTESQRAMIAAQFAQRSPGNRRQAATSKQGAEDQLTAAEAARLLGIGRTSVERGRDVLRHGSSELQQSVRDGQIPVYTAARIARSTSAEQQDEFVQRISNGADPRKIAPASASARPAPPTPRAASHGKQRHRHIGVNAVEHLQYALDALEVVLDSAPDGLDPSITSEQASHLLTGLSRSTAQQRRLIALLRTRKESTT